MDHSLRVAACQTPDIRADVPGALAWMRRAGAEADAAGVDLICFPECFLQGYLTDEASARRHGMDLTGPVFAGVGERLSGVRATIVFGLIEAQDGTLFNSAVVIERGRLVGAYRKSRILSGERFFGAGAEFPIFRCRGLSFGINICADTGVPGPAAEVARAGAALILCPANNMLPREAADEWRERHNPARAARARENGVWVVSADVTGERDGCVSYGPTAIVDPQGVIVAQVPLMTTGMVCADIVPASVVLAEQP